MGKYTIKNGFLVRDKSPYGEWGDSLKVRDVAFQFRMGNGFAGAVNRSHPVDIVPMRADPSNPPTFFGQPVLLNPTAGTVRSLIDADRTGSGSGGISGGAAGGNPIVDVFGIVVRPYPFQGVLPGTANYAGVPAFYTGGLPDGALDILVSGFIMVSVVTSVAAPSNGSQAFVWTIASSSPHVQGGWEGGATASSTVALTWDKTTFASPVDANGIAELRFNV